MVDLKVTAALFELLRTVFSENGKLGQDSAKALKEHLAAIYEISKRNDMAHLVGYALEKQKIISPEDEIFFKFQQRQYLAIFRCEKMEHEIAKMREILESEGIDFVLLKGAAIREYYPEGWMRTSSDIDILVRQESIDRADALFSERLGYRRVTVGSHDRAFFSESNVHVELHFSLVEDNRAQNAADVLGDVWSYATRIGDKKHEHRLSAGMFYFYHIAHLGKHMERSGSGMRFFIDLWLINKHMVGEADKIEIADHLRRGKLERFALLCDQLSAHWMEGTFPSEDIKRLELFVVNCGIYGSEENRITIDRKKRGGTVGYIWRRLFMPYDVLKQFHPALQKHKWLMPFFQIARWFKLLTGKKTKQAVKEIKVSASVSRQDAEEMQSFLTEIGLK